MVPIIKTMLDPNLRSEIIQRAQQLNVESKPLWGSMNVYQMVRHCRMFEAWVHGIGDWDYSMSRSTPEVAAAALAGITADNTPMMRVAPSAEMLIIPEIEGDFEEEKKLWINHLHQYANYKNDLFIHDFFGKMTPEQVGILAYKHSDHHLRQFGV